MNPCRRRHPSEILAEAPNLMAGEERRRRAGTHRGALVSSDETPPVTRAVER